MAHPVSPLAPKTYPALPQIAGVRFATAEAGIKYKNRTDVLRCFHFLEVPLGAGRLVQGQPQARQGARASGQLR
jgi:hypothetical protein